MMRCLATDCTIRGLLTFKKTKLVFYFVLSSLKLKCRQYPAIHTNYSCSNCTISNYKDLNRSSEFLVIN